MSNNNFKKNNLFVTIFIFILLIVVAIVLGILLGNNVIENRQETDKQIESSQNSSNEKKATVNTDKEKKEVNVPDKKQAPSKNNVISKFEDGEYIVGKNMPEGEYKILSDKGYGFFECSSNPSSPESTVIYTENFKGNSYFIVHKGQYVRIRDCYAIPIAKAPKFSGPNITEGVYKVGFDIPAGQYTIKHGGNGSYFEITKVPHDISAILSNNLIDNDIVVNVNNGQYLKLSNTSAVKN